MGKIKNLVTVKHGSHLYGLNHQDSDLDLYTVYDFLNKRWRPNKQISKIIEGETDQFKLSLDAYMGQVRKGTPTALETLFSKPKHWLDYTDEWVDIINSVKLLIDDRAVLKTYRRVIIKLTVRDDFKLNRHAFRLLLNASWFDLTGEFDPELSSEQVDIVNANARLPWKERKEKIKDLLWDIKW